MLPLFDERTDHTQRVVNRAVGFVDHETVGAAHENRHSLTRVLHTRHFNHFARRSALFLDQSGFAQFLGHETAVVCDRDQTQRLRPKDTKNAVVRGWLQVVRSVVRENVAGSGEGEVEEGVRWR